MKMRRWRWSDGARGRVSDETRGAMGRDQELKL